jgi:hypothetical protein
MFVQSLSWQNDRFYIENCSKLAFVAGGPSTTRGSRHRAMVRKRDTICSATVRVTIILTRQARDKHRDRNHSTKRAVACCAGAPAAAPKGVAPNLAPGPGKTVVALFCSPPLNALQKKKTKIILPRHTRDKPMDGWNSILEKDRHAGSGGGGEGGGGGGGDEESPLLGKQQQQPPPPPPPPQQQQQQS